MAFPNASLKTPPRAAEAVSSAARPELWLLILLSATLLWDWTGADLPVMQLLGTPEGFALRHQWLLERVLHDGLRLVSQLIYLMLWVWALWPARWTSTRAGPLMRPRRERLAIVWLIALSLLAVNLVKNYSLTSCPWELHNFGGNAIYVSHWDFWRGDLGPGRCFPGGHASSGFAFLALCLPWLDPVGPRPVQRQRGMHLLMLILGIGVLAGAAQTLRGAHYPSHTLWTLLICGAVSLAGWRLARPWLAAQQIR